MRELVRGKNTIGPEVIDPGGRSVEKPREVTLTLTLFLPSQIVPETLEHSHLLTLLSVREYVIDNFYFLKYVSARDYSYIP
jgi:hypothetical protein